MGKKRVTQCFCVFFFLVNVCFGCGIFLDFEGYDYHGKAKDIVEDIKRYTASVEGKTIEKISLRNTNLDAEDLCAFVDALQDQRFENIKSLLLCNNDLRGGGKSLARVLNNFPNLEVLDLERAHLAPNDFSVFVNNIQAERVVRIKTFILNKNNLSGSGYAIAELINKMPKLEELDMERTKIQKNL